MACAPSGEAWALPGCVLPDGVGVVNYYSHHIGDYDSHTAHLSWLEDCAYRRLLCLYYRTEKAIPLNAAAVCRLLRAQSKPEAAAIATVLDEFFSKTDAGWVHQRCVDEISEAAKRQAAARKNGGFGGRPSKAKAIPGETQWVIAGLPNGNPEVISGLANGNPELTQPKPPNTNTNTNTSEGVPPSGAEPPTGPSGEDAPTDPAGPRKQLWDMGVAVLGDKARSLIGQAIKRVGEQSVGEALGRLATKPMADPKTFFIKLTTPKERGFVC